jgi:hypothetical protein
MLLDMSGGTEMIRTLLAGLATLALAAPVHAGASTAGDLLFHHRAGTDALRVDFTRHDSFMNIVDFTTAVDDVAQPVHAAAIQHSDAYLTRAKIHRIASYASIPLFAAELYLGESLYNSADPQAHKGAHVVVGTGIIALFGVNTVTGGWNLFGAEGRSDTQDRTIKLIHGLLMMAADAGFVATVATAPNSHRDTIPSESAKALHRNVALTSIALGATGYGIMFVHNF